MNIDCWVHQETGQVRIKIYEAMPPEQTPVGARIYIKIEESCDGKKNVLICFSYIYLSNGREID